jgi:hypothetical protein
MVSEDDYECSVNLAVVVGGLMLGSSPRSVGVTRARSLGDSL